MKDKVEALQGVSMLRVSTILAVLLAIGFPFRGYTQTSQIQTPVCELPASPDQRL